MDTLDRVLLIVVILGVVVVSSLITLQLSKEFICEQLNAKYIQGECIQWKSTAVPAVQKSKPD